MIFGMTYYQICMYFLLYSFLGWVIEVAYHAVTLGKVVNRGFLNGPVCPVYGFGMLAVLAMANQIGIATSDAEAAAASSGMSDELSTFILFLGGMVLTTAIELVAGWLLDTLFHARWWDYSDKPLNFHGYICPEFSILWGLAVVLVVKVIHPLLTKHTSSSIPEQYGWPVMLVLYLIYLADVIVTTATVRGMNKKFAELDAMRRALRAPSDALSDVVATGTIKTAQHVEEAQVQAALAKAEVKDAAARKKEEMQDTLAVHKAAAETNARKRKEVARAAAYDLKERAADAKESRTAKNEALRAEYEAKAAAFFAHPHFGARRLLNAFPEMKHRDYEDVVRDLRQRHTDGDKNAENHSA